MKKMSNNRSVIMKELLFSLNSKDFKWDFFKTSGPGGQNKNKRDTERA